jgi:hypothetical protein
LAFREKAKSEIAATGHFLLRADSGSKVDDSDLRDFVGKIAKIGQNPLIYILCENVRFLPKLTIANAAVFSGDPDSCPQSHPSYKNIAGRVAEAIKQASRVRQPSSCALLH